MMVNTDRTKVLQTGALMRMRAVLCEFFRQDWRRCLLRGSAASTRGPQSHLTRLRSRRTGARVRGAQGGTASLQNRLYAHQCEATSPLL